MIKRKEKYLTFSFELQIKDLKNFTNLISQIKQSNLRFKIIRHKQKKMLSLEESLKILKKLTHFWRDILFCLLDFIALNTFNARS